MSYVPKKNKSVILLSTHHHTADIDYDQVSNKPQITNYYNSTKGNIKKICSFLDCTISIKYSRKLN